MLGDRSYVTKKLNLKKKEMRCLGEHCRMAEEVYGRPVALGEMASWGILVFTTVRTRHSSTYTAVLLQGMGTNTIKHDLGKQSVSRVE